MSKSIIWTLALIGFIFLLIGALFSKCILLIGLIIIGVGVFLGVGPDGVLRKEQIIDTWSALISNAQGHSPEIFQNTQLGINDSKAPSLTMERKSISPGMVRGIFGAEREFLIVTNEENSRLRPYKVFLNARDYGENLDLSWYLTYRPSLWNALAAMLPFGGTLNNAVNELDTFDQQDLRAYVTVAHHSLLQTVEKLMLSMQQDPSKIERKSRGFLGIS